MILKRLVLLGFSVGAVLCFGQEVWAKPRHCPPGHAKKGWCVPGAGLQMRGPVWQDPYARRASRSTEYYEGRVSSGRGYGSRPTWRY
jgi:hypothetical protein